MILKSPYDGALVNANFHWMLLLLATCCVVSATNELPVSSSQNKFLQTNAEPIRSSRSEVFCKKGVLRNFTKFTGKQLCQSLFFNKVAGLSPGDIGQYVYCNCLWTRLWLHEFQNQPYLSNQAIFSTWAKSQDKNLLIMRTIEIKSTRHHFWRAIIDANKWESHFKWLLTTWRRLVSLVGHISKINIRCFPVNCAKF